MTSPSAEAGSASQPDSIAEIPTRSAAAAAAAARRRACNECKQQKLRCDLPVGCGDTLLDYCCSRCTKLDLDCKIESTFKRTRKRRRSVELEREIAQLKRQLSTQNRALLEWQLSASGSGAGAGAGADLNLSPANGSTFRREIHSTRMSQSGDAVEAAARAISVPTATVASPDSEHHSRAPGVTTRPQLDQQEESRRIPLTLPRPSRLGNIKLSVEEIDELFLIYFQHYHPYLPFLDAFMSPQEYFEASELLFWSIISAASHRLHSNPTLLPRLARNVTDLLWKTLREIPYSIRAVQSLILICTWPFPTSSSITDPTYMLAGLMVQIGTQMGLHRALNARDFNKIPIKLNSSQYAEWVRTWAACNIVAQSVSIGFGLPAPVQMHDWSLTVAPESTSSFELETSLKAHLRIEKFRHRVLQTFASNAFDPAGLMSSAERQPLYRLLHSALNDLEGDVRNLTNISKFYFSAARLHLHSFYLFDEPSIPGYADRIVALYQSSCGLIELGLQMDSEEVEFFQYCPFFAYQSFLAASFILLKVTMNGFFSTLLDIDAGKKLINAAISAIRKISVTNNDLPGRLGDVLTFLCTTPDTQIISGETVEGLQLSVRSRLTMSIIYDSLWEWRKYFQTEQGSAGRQDQLDSENVLCHSTNSSQNMFTFDHLASLTDSFDFRWTE